MADDGELPAGVFLGGGDRRQAGTDGTSDLNIIEIVFYRRKFFADQLLVIFMQIW